MKTPDTPPEKQPSTDERKRLRPPFRKISERTRDRIDELAAQGYFSNLPGSGKPLDFSVENNPFIPEDLRASYRILANAGFGLPWMEDRKVIDRRRSDMERDLQSHLTHVRSSLGGLRRMPAYLRPSRWDRLQSRHEAFVARFARQLESLNNAIDTYNLSVPSLSLQVPRMKRREILAELAAAMPESLDANEASTKQG